MLEKATIVAFFVPEGNIKNTAKTL